MPVFKEMDPEDAFKAIEGHKDTLNEEADSLDALYRRHRCPRCQGNLTKEFDSRHVFSEDTQIGRALLRCGICRYLIDPFSGLVLETGDPSKIPDPVIPLIDPTPD